MLCVYIFLSVTVSAAAGGGGAHEGLAVPEAVQQLAFADRILLNKVFRFVNSHLSRVDAALIYGFRSATLLLGSSVVLDDS